MGATEGMRDEPINMGEITPKVPHPETDKIRFFIGIQTTRNEYIAQLIAKERGVPMVDIKLTVPTEETAAAICDNWQEKNQEIYQYLTRQLF